ncbi:MAG: hypothetical protein DRP22_00025 [Verrucomicrobia bacterium]|nr:MAG: hypothetical protein DRP22_00025 [Verrucomicrobiota bacterium]
MAKLLKPLIVVLLVLSVLSLSLGLMLFAKREELRGRADRFQEAVIQIAEKLHVEDLDVAALADYNRMQGPLAQVAAVADNTYESVQNTKADLEKARNELDSVQQELAAVQSELKDAKDQIASLSSQLETKEVELAQAQARIQQLQDDKALLEREVQDTREELARAQDEARDLADQVTALEHTVRDLEARLGERIAAAVPRGLSGNVLIVNRPWNFVVVDLGSKDGLVPNIELLVHRGDRLVGKVRVSTVREKFSIAEIVRDWERLPVQEGDRVLY